MELYQLAPLDLIVLFVSKSIAILLFFGSIMAFIQLNRESRGKEIDDYDLKESIWLIAQRLECLLMIIIGFLVLNLSEYSISDFQ